MFEEICLVCGRPLKDDGRAYCSDDCQSRDVSPSISSSSSALSSPKLDSTHGGDIPALMPSALGSALKSYAGRNGGTYISSSSASSTSWSTLTDEEDEVAVHHHGTECIYHDKTDPICDGGSQSANLIHSLNPSALFYARRPSGTNNPSTVPGPLKYVRGVPRSVPNGFHSSADDEDEEAFSDAGFSSGDALDDHELGPEKSWRNLKPKYSGAKTKRTRNRASLPACFSLLQMTSPSKGVRSSPVSSSYGTVAHLSPPTPKLALNTGASQQDIALTNPQSTDHTTPRGRQRENNKSRSSRHSRHSSPSRSRSRHVIMGESLRPMEYAFPVRLRSEDGHEHHLDRPAIPGVLPNRGRTTMRRNSSPAPKALMGVEEQSVLVAALVARMADSSPSNSRSRPRTRGRARVDELEGQGLSMDAPGYGNGRSGLVDRERGIGPHARVPL